MGVQPKTTVVGSFAVLLPVLVSCGGKRATVALLVMLLAPIGVPAPIFTVSVSAGSAAPAASPFVLVQTTFAVLVPVQFQPVPPKLANVRLPGKVSVTL